MLLDAKITLDTVNGWTVNRAFSPIKNFRNLFDLKFGIMAAATHVRNYELEEQKKDHADGVHINFSADSHSSMIVNLFYWFSVNTISFAKCCALLNFVNLEGKQPDVYPYDKSLNRRLKKHCNDYIDSIPELEMVRFFRNKSGAHLAFTDPRPEDNPATLLESVATNIGYARRRYRAGILTMGKGEHSSEYGDKSFSVTEVFEALKERYEWDYLDGRE